MRKGTYCVPGLQPLYLILTTALCVRQVLLFPFHRWRTGSSGRLINLPTAVPLVNGIAEVTLCPRLLFWWDSFDPSIASRNTYQTCFAANKVIARFQFISKLKMYLLWGAAALFQACPLSPSRECTILVINLLLAWLKKKKYLLWLEEWFEQI